MKHSILGYRITGKFTVACPSCGGNTTLKYARTHDGLCKACATQKNCGPCYRAGKGIVFGCNIARMG